MKTMKFARRFMSIIFIASLLMACTDDGLDGAIGPQGPMGEQGVQGEQGASGTDGIQGNPGTSNVIYSDWIPSDFPETINDTFDQWEIFAPELTQEIHDTGVILIYARRGAIIYQIPDSFFAGVQEHWDFRLLDFNDDLIAIRVHSINGLNIGTPHLNGDFRYIIIPGGIASSGKTTIDYSKMAYEEVIAHFNIPE